MMKHFFPRLTRLSAPLMLCVLLVAPMLSAPFARAQKNRRETLTPQEFEFVADAQELELRTKVFIKIAERRLLALTNPSAFAQSQTAKEVETWGELPKGTRAALFNDAAELLSEAVTNIDDAYERNNGSPLVLKATRKLGEAASKWLPQLLPLRETAADDPEREALEQAIDKLQEILDAAKKVPDEAVEKKGEKKKN